MAGTSTYNDFKTVFFPADGSQNTEQEKLKLVTTCCFPETAASYILYLCVVL
jgi:hypothetical protein